MKDWRKIEVLTREKQERLEDQQKRDYPTGQMGKKMLCVGVYYEKIKKN